MTLGDYRDGLSPYDRRIFDDMCDSFIDTAVQLLLEAEVDDKTVKTVIGNHWNISSTHFSRILGDQKIVLAQHWLEEFLKDNNYSESEISDFFEKNMVEAKLRKDHDLMMQWRQPEKLYKAIQAKKKK